MHELYGPIGIIYVHMLYLHIFYLRACIQACLEKGGISANRRLEAYYCYIELLRRFKQYSKANEIIMQTDIANNNTLNQYGVIIYISCSICGKEVSGHMPSISYCQKCKVNISNCIICCEPVRGLYRWCAVCSHGGHVECTKLWYNKHVVCPSGCGHECNLSMMGGNGWDGGGCGCGGVSEVCLPTTSIMTPKSARPSRRIGSLTQ